MLNIGPRPLHTHLRTKKEQKLFRRNDSTLIKYQWYNIKINIYISYAEMHLMYIVGRLLIVN